MNDEHKVRELCKAERKAAGIGYHITPETHDYAARLKELNEILGEIPKEGDPRHCELCRRKNNVET